jgi:hypothetical protein
MPKSRKNKSKPIDIWLFLFGMAGAIIVWLNPPKTPIIIIIALMVVGGLLFHPLWNFWWIEKKLLRRFIAMCFLIVALFGLGYISWPKLERQTKEQQPLIVPTPNLASIRIASQKQIVSDDPQLPYGLEVILQTDTPIEPVAFEIEFNGEIGEGKAGFVSSGIYQFKKRPTIKNGNILNFGWESPAFTPDKPIKIIVFSKNYVKAIKYHKLQYTWP